MIIHTSFQTWFEHQIYKKKKRITKIKESDLIKFIDIWFLEEGTERKEARVEFHWSWRELSRTEDGEENGGKRKIKIITNLWPTENKMNRKQEK